MASAGCLHALWTASIRGKNSLDSKRMKIDGAVSEFGIYSDAIWNLSRQALGRQRLHECED